MEWYIHSKQNNESLLFPANYWYFYLQNYQLFYVAVHLIYGRAKNVSETSDEQKLQLKLLKLKPGNMSLFLKGNG